MLFFFHFFFVFLFSKKKKVKRKELHFFFRAKQTYMGSPADPKMFAFVMSLTCAASQLSLEYLKKLATMRAWSASSVDVQSETAC